MVSWVNSHTNATSKRWHLWEIDLRFALNSTPGWLEHFEPLRGATCSKFHETVKAIYSTRVFLNFDLSPSIQTQGRLLAGGARLYPGIRARAGAAPQHLETLHGPQEACHARARVPTGVSSGRDPLFGNF